MTTKKELTAKIAELQAQVDAMPDEPSGYWKPEYKGRYWYLDAEGDTSSDIWTDDGWDAFRLSQGNVFIIEEGAEHHKKKLDVIGKIRLAAMEDIAENGELDWGKRSPLKYKLHYHTRDKQWIVNLSRYLKNPTTIYFKTKAAAEKCLADLGDELDILIGEG